MSSAGIRFEGKSVSVDGRTWKAPYPIADAKTVGERVFLIFDGMAGPSHRQFQNLKAFDPEGSELWTAEHPTTDSADCYVKFLGGEASDCLLVLNFNSFVCRIDSDTGKLLETTFTK